MPPTPERRVVFGAFQPDLENALVSEIDALRRAGGPLRPALLLVGSNLLGLHLTRLIARRLGGVGGLRIMTFLDLARAVARPVMEREGLRPTPPAGEQLLARGLAASLPDASYFTRIARTEGFEEAILATIRDLRDGGAGPGHLRRIFPARRGKLRDLADLLERYEERLRKARLIDRPGLMARALAIAESAGAGRAPGATEPLFVYGFYDFTGIQERLLLALAARLSTTTIFFPWQDTPAFEFARSARARLLEAGFIPEPPGGPAGAPAAPSGAAFGDGALARLQSRLFTPVLRAAADARSKDPAAAIDPSVRIVAAPGEGREVLEAARIVVQWARSGIPLEEIGILFRSGEPYTALVAAQLFRLGIRCFSPAGRGLRLTRTARALFSLLRIRERDHEREDVIEFLTLADLDLGILRAGHERGAAAPSPRNPSDWDLLSRMAGIVSGRKTWDAQLERLARALAFRIAKAGAGGDPESDPPPDPRLSDECLRLRRLHASLAKALDDLPEEASWGDMTEAIDRLVRRFLAPGEEREAVRETIGVLASLNAIQSRTTLAEFRSVLASELETRGPGEGRFQRGHVFAGDIQSARGLGFRAVVILGLTEQSFPPPVRQDPVLLDAERRRLNEAAADATRLPIKAERLKEERLLFTLAAGSAREALALIFPRLDPQTARERLPSSFLLRTIEAVTGESCDYARLLKNVEWVRLSDLFPADRATSLREDEFDLSVVAEGLRLGDPAIATFPALQGDRPPFFARGIRFEQMRWGQRGLTAVDGVLRDPAALAILARRHGLQGVPVSPTRLEQYMTCPYQYFCGRILGLEPLEAPERIERLSPRDRGTLVHRVLHEFFAALRRSADLPLRKARRPALRETLAGIVTRRFAEVEATGLAGFPLLRDLERQKIGEDLERFLDREIETAEAGGADGLRPAHFEVRFGMPPRRDSRPDPVPDDPLSADEPVRLAIDDKTLLFKGQIDRIDLTADGSRARVIDYKSGSLDDFPENSHGAGTALQGLVYMLATEHLLRDTRVEQALYQSVSRRGGFRSRGLDRATWEGMLGDLRAIGRLVEDGIASGTFFINPEETRCRRCDHQPVCGEAREARFDRKRTDAAALPFLDFKTRSET